MLDELEGVPANGRSVTLEDSATQKELVTELVILESAHEAIEERYFWPSVQHWIEEGRDLAAPALEQEQAAKQVLQELEIWPIVLQRMARSGLDELDEKMATAKKPAPGAIATRC